MYVPGSSLAHRLDPRAKLAVQVAFALAAFAHTSPRGLLVATGVVACCLWTARTAPWEALTELRLLVPFLLAGPLVEMVVLGPPWLAPERAVAPALASYRTLLVVLVAAAYVRTTPTRESQAALQWLVPGKPGRALGLCVGLVARYLTVLRADLRRTRTAMRARLGDQLPVRERIRIVAVAGLGRVFDRSDRLALAMRARCLAWNPTLPRLRFGRADALALVLALALLGWAVVPVLPALLAPFV